MKTNRNTLTIVVYGVLCGVLAGGMFMLDRSLVSVMVLVASVCLAGIIRFMESRNKHSVWLMYFICVFCLVLCLSGIRQSASLLLDRGLAQTAKNTAQKAMLVKKDSSLDMMSFQTLITVLACLISFVFAMKNNRLLVTVNRINLLLSAESAPKGTWGAENPSVCFFKARTRSLDSLTGTSFALLILYLIQIAGGVLLNTFCYGVYWKRAFSYCLSVASLNAVSLAIPLLFVQLGLRDQIPNMNVSKMARIMTHG